MSRFTKKERSWILYDWANSAYSIIITTAIFPLFYESITPERIYVATWGFANSGASLIIALLAPLLGTIADYRGNKKRFFSFFFAVGVASTLALALFEQGEWLPALLVYVASAIGFAGANIFYDSFLTDVSEPKRMDWVSANGFGWGYIGSVLPFVASLLLVINSEALGFERSTSAVRLAFLITGLWWGVFAIPILKNVKQIYFVEPSPTPMRDSFKRLATTFRNIRQYRQVFLFLAAYFFYIDGVDTIIKMATPIARSMGIESNMLLIILLAIQLVAFPFAILYGKLAQRFSARKMLFVGIAVYILVVFVAFLLPSFEDLGVRTALFWVLSMLVASSQGGIQALSRSFYGKIIPPDKSAEFFGFYNIFGRFAAIIGPLLVGGFTLITGQERFGILSVLMLFIAGGALLRLVEEPAVNAEER